jgi:hypothetical protein
MGEIRRALDPSRATARASGIVLDVHVQLSYYLLAGTVSRETLTMSLHQCAW